MSVPKSSKERIKRFLRNRVGQVVTANQHVIWRAEGDLEPLPQHAGVAFSQL